MIEKIDLSEEVKLFQQNLKRSLETIPEGDKKRFFKMLIGALQNASFVSRETSVSDRFREYAISIEMLLKEKD